MPIPSTRELVECLEGCTISRVEIKGRPKRIIITFTTGEQWMIDTTIRGELMSLIMWPDGSGAGLNLQLTDAERRKRVQQCEEMDLLRVRMSRGMQ